MSQCVWQQVSVNVWYCVFVRCECTHESMCKRVLVCESMHSCVNVCICMSVYVWMHGKLSCVLPWIPDRTGSSAVSPTQSWGTGTQTGPRFRIPSLLFWPSRHHVVRVRVHERAQGLAVSGFPAQRTSRSYPPPWVQQSSCCHVSAVPADVTHQDTS